MRLIRPLLVAVLLGALALAGGEPAAAQTGCENAQVGSACSGTTPGTTTPGEETSGGGGGGVPVDYERYFDPDGIGVGAEPGYEDDGCWGIRAVAEGQGTSYEEAVASQSSQGENGVLWGNCLVEETIDPVFLAQEYWRRAVVPPPPTPLSVAQGRALTGLTTYLEIGGEIPDVQTFGTPIGTLTFTLTPRYVVSWGDGASTSTPSQGGPHPTGDVTHLYTEEGDVTIVVQAFWTATWSLAGAGGELPEHPVATQDELPLPVEQYQAVIDPE